VPNFFCALVIYSFTRTSKKQLSKISLTESQTPDLLEILEDRYGRASTMLATQIPVADWHDRLGNATLSDAVMDRIIHNAYRLELCGESMRKRRAPLTHSGHKEV